MAISAPSDISGLILDIDPHEASYQDTAGTTPAGNGDSVARVDDQAGTEHVTQATGANQPTLSADANGWLRLLFDGTNDDLNNSTFQPPSSGAQPFSVIVVCSVNNIGASQILVSDGISRTFAYRTADHQAFWGSPFRAGAPTFATRFVHHVEINGASSEQWRNNASLGTGNAGADAWAAGVYLGRAASGTLPLSGYIWRLLIYSKVLSSTERTDLYDHLSAKYAGSPPAAGRLLLLRRRAVAV